MPAHLFTQKLALIFIRIENHFINFHWQDQKRIWSMNKRYLRRFFGYGEPKWVKDTRRSILTRHSTNMRWLRILVNLRSKQYFSVCISSISDHDLQPPQKQRLWQRFYDVVFPEELDYTASYRIDVDRNLIMTGYEPWNMGELDFPWKTSAELFPVPPDFCDLFKRLTAQGKEVCEPTSISHTALIIDKKRIFKYLTFISRNSYEMSCEGTICPLCAF